jgi:RNA polymerase sigma-70 factor (ECF subfamily)
MTRPVEPEADLVRACVAGDAAAWRRFVDRYGALVTALSRRMLARRTGSAQDSDVEEVASEVFLALVRGDARLLRRYRPEFRLTTYLGVICRTEVGKHLRRRNRTPAPGGEAVEARDDPAAPQPLAEVARRERDAAVTGLLRVLQTLPERDRLLLSLRFVDGLDYGAIAEVLRVHRESVGQLLHRAKARLARKVPELRQWVDAGE